MTQVGLTLDPELVYAAQRLVFEDSPLGIIAAERAGMGSVLVSRAS